MVKSPKTQSGFLRSRRRICSREFSQPVVPKARIGDELVAVTKERIEGDDGTVSFKFKKADGSELSAAELKTLIYTNPSSDGKADKTLDVGWWGSCDKVALAGVLFKEPLKDEVTIDGVTFTKNDVLGLLTVIADSQAMVQILSAAVSMTNSTSW